MHIQYLKLKLKICVGMSAKLIANDHLQIYKHTAYDSDLTKVLNKHTE